MTKVKKVKMKTKKAAAKRFPKATAKGKILRGKQGHGHFLSKNGQAAGDLQGTTYVSNSDFDKINALVPALGAKKKRTRALKKAAAMLVAAKNAVKTATKSAPAAK